MKKVAYPGELGKLSSARTYLFHAAGEAGHTGSNDPLRKATMDRECALLAELLTHFQIDPNDTHLWFHLALRLARNHVPAFTFSWARRGRKGKKTTLAGLLGLDKAKRRKPGRPRKWKTDDYEILLALREKGGKLLRERQPDGKITDVAALKAANARFGKDNGVKLSERFIDRVSRIDAKRLSDARKFVRKSSGN